MALKLKKKQAAQAEWCDFEQEGEVAAKFLIRPIDDNRYQVAVERLRNKTYLDGFDTADIPADAMPWFEQDAQAVARYLIADWQGLEDTDGTAVPYSAEKAAEVLTQTDIGLVLWAFVKTEAERLKDEAEAEEAETVKKP